MQAYRYCTSTPHITKKVALIVYMMSWQGISNSKPMRKAIEINEQSVNLFASIKIIKDIVRPRNK